MLPENNGSKGVLYIPQMQFNVTQDNKWFQV